MPHGLLDFPDMNSLNIITTRVSPPPSPSPSRSNSLGQLGISLAHDNEKAADKTASKHDSTTTTTMEPCQRTATETTYDEKDAATEETPLLNENKDSEKRSRWWHTIPRDFASSIITSIRWVLATLASPGVYFMACLCDQNGNFAPWARIKSLFGVRKHKPGLEDYGVARAAGMEGDGHLDPSHAHQRRVSSRLSSTSSSSSDSDFEETKSKPGGHVRSKSVDPTDEANLSRKSIRIKLSSEDLEKRKHRKTQSAVARTKNDMVDEALAARIKSPTSPIAALTKYPRAPAPPRPLIPRRQPSYLNVEPPRKPTKTLILDLDETLIHSMSKGGRMSTGHMVEVRLNAASLGMGSGQGPLNQHPILYWVNKRPYCDEFLRRVCKWFNLVVFTASVQEYADPVIDWLEQERKFFSARYYRQHCTLRQGAYIKDLSSVEPDLSSVVILDNSPLSYLFHEDNAIPIQGWINDPTDYDLMHLIPLLEGLQYVNDVRSFLALRGGEEGQSMA